jgi:hypothetical protein
MRWATTFARCETRSIQPDFPEQKHRPIRVPGIPLAPVRVTPGTRFRGFSICQLSPTLHETTLHRGVQSNKPAKGNNMGNTEQAPSKRVRIVLCAAAFSLAAAVPGAGLAADWTSAKIGPNADWTSARANPTADWTSGLANPTADWTSGLTKPTADWTSGKTKPAADWTSMVKSNADWTSAKIKPNADWTSRVKPNASWTS